jgi:hypothetical protein
MAKLETVTVTAPQEWACYLVNGDGSGIDDLDAAHADAMVADVGLGSPVDAADDAQLTAYPDYPARDADGRRLAADCVTYSFLRPLP